MSVKFDGFVTNGFRLIRGARYTFAGLNFHVQVPTMFAFLAGTSNADTVTASLVSQFSAIMRTYAYRYHLKIGASLS